MSWLFCATNWLSGLVDIICWQNLLIYNLSTLFVETQFVDAIWLQDLLDRICWHIFFDIRCVDIICWDTICCRRHSWHNLWEVFVGKEFVDVPGYIYVHDEAMLTCVSGYVYVLEGVILWRVSGYFELNDTNWLYEVLRELHMCLPMCTSSVPTESGLLCLHVADFW